MKYQTRTRDERGFSLVEMLVVIAVIGVITAIAVPSIGAISDKASTAKAKRNAQTICSLYGSARSVGVTFAATDKSGITDELIAGKSGAVLGEFTMSPLSEIEKQAALAYVSYDLPRDAMKFDPSGGQATGGAQGWVGYGAFERGSDASSSIAGLADLPILNGRNGADVNWRIIPAVWSPELEENYVASGIAGRLSYGSQVYLTEFEIPAGYMFPPVESPMQLQ